MPPKTQKIRILVADDHSVVREGIRAVVNAQPDMTVAGEACDGNQAIERFKSLQPDVSLVDWNLPVVHGAEVIRRLRYEFPTAKFIVITALNGDETIRQALQLGVQSYLFKDTLRRELLPAIRAVDEGKQYFPYKILSRRKNGN